MATRNRKGSSIWLIALLAGVGLLSYYITTLTVSVATRKAETPDQVKIPQTYPHQEQAPVTKRGERGKTGRLDLAAIHDGALPNQRVIMFKDKAALEAFLARMGEGVDLLGRLDKLNALRIGFSNEDALLALLDGNEETGFIYPVNIPEFTAGAQAGAVPLGSGLLNWLGVTGDNSQWGEGIKIAILDTGIADHIAFKNAIERINLVPLPADPADLNGHGTAMASLIFSTDRLAPGIAPAATPLSIRIANDEGFSDTFLIAQGILAALDAKAPLINISLGGSKQSNLMEAALAEAREAGALVIASAGNNGSDRVMQPAASPLAIAVGAVDARNQHLAFSNIGSEIAVSAPGLGVNAAIPGDRFAAVNGTSPAAPIITGTLAATMNNGGNRTLSGTQALAAMNANLNDIGAPGGDPFTGAGVPDMWRILNGNTPGIHDAAITSLTTSDGQIQALVQNLGTETLLNAGVSLNVNGVTTHANITTLAPGDTRVITVPAGSGENPGITGRVQLSGSQRDQRPSNNSLTQTSPAP